MLFHSYNRKSSIFKNDRETPFSLILCAVLDHMGHGILLFEAQKAVVIHGKIAAHRLCPQYSGWRFH